MPVYIGTDISGRLSRRFRREEAKTGSEPPARKPKPGSAAPRPLAFDPLEPRVLLNADILAVQLAAMPADTADHDLLVRMSEHTEQTGTRAQTVQRVEIVDTANGAILAFGDLADISAVSIAGGIGDDSVTIDADSFGAHSLPPVAFDGGAGTNSLAIEHTDSLQNWRFDGNGAGSADGAARATFAGISRLTGGAGDDALRGPAADSTWLVTEPGTGTVGGLAFGGFERLTGGIDNRDLFVVTGTGAIRDGVHGGDGGYDTLEIDGESFSRVAMRAIDGSSGSVDTDGRIIAYTGMEPITLGGIVADLTLDLSIFADTATLSDGTANDGKMTLSTTGTAETQVFDLPTNSLTITLGLGNDTLNIASVDAGFKAALSVSGGLGSDTVTVSSALLLPGKAATIDADTIIVAGTGSITTGLAGKAAGAISLTGQTISLLSGASLNAAALGGGTAGDVTLAASDTVTRVTSFDPTGLPFRQNNASISLSGASISGGNISITAEAKDLGTTDLGDFTKGFVGQLSGLLDQFLGIALSSVTGIDATVQVRASTATVDLLASTVTAAGTVTITSEAQTDSSVSALALPPSFGKLAGKNAPAIAIGYGQATGTAETTVRGASIITAADDVMVGAQGNVRAKVEARTVANLGLFGADPNGENVSVAIAAAYTNTTVKAQVGQGATVQSTGGDVSILAGGIDEAGKPVTVNNNPSAKTTTYGNGRAGVAVAFGFDITKVDALVDGTVKAAGHAQTVKTIDPATAVNANTNVITLPGHGFGTGQFVKYRTNGGQAIGGLTADTDYQVVRVDADHFYLTQGDAVDIGVGADPLSVHSLAVRATATFATADVNNAASTLTVSGTAFSNGMTVVYSDENEEAVGGLTDQTAYTIANLTTDIVNNRQTFQLRNPVDGTIIALTKPSVDSTQYLIYTTTSKTFNAVADVSADTDTIAFAAAHGFQTGDIVRYATDPTRSTVSTTPIYARDANGLYVQVDSDTSTPAIDPLTVTSPDAALFGLANGQAYYIVRVDALHVRLADSLEEALAAAPVDLTGAGTGASHGFDTEAKGGVKIKAALESTNKAGAEPSVGNDIAALSAIAGTAGGQAEFPALFLSGVANGLMGKGFSAGKYFGEIKKLQDATKTKSDGGTGGGMGQYFSHHVLAQVGSTGVVESGSDVTIEAKSKQKATQLKGAAAISIKGGGDAFAFQFGIGIYNTDVHAIIQSGASVDASGKIKLDSKNQHPLMLLAKGKDGDSFFTALGATLKDQISSGGLKALTDFMDGTGGIATKLANNWNMATAKGEGTLSFALAGSGIAYFNTSEAVIKSGAQINQKALFQTPIQAVSLDAKTTMALVEIAGNAKFSLKPDLINKYQAENRLLARDFMDLTSSRSKDKGIGGVISVSFVSNTTKAVIEAGVALRTGTTGSGLALKADEDVFHLGIAQSGGTAGGSSGFGFSGSGLGFAHESETTAAILTDPALGTTRIIGGAVALDATSNIIQITVAGAITTALPEPPKPGQPAPTESGGSAIGISVGVNNVNRTVRSFIGVDPGSADPITAAAPPAKLQMDATKVSIESHASGGLYAFTIAGAVVQQFQGVGDSPDDALDGLALPGLFGDAASAKTSKGFSGSGSVAVNRLTGTTESFINDAGTLHADGVELLADDSSDLIVGTGSASLIFSSPSGATSGSSSTALAGTFSFNQTAATTRAYVRGVQLSTDADGLSVTATRTGLLGAGSIAFSGALVPGSDSTAVAANISLNFTNDVTRAFLQGVSMGTIAQPSVGDVTVHATNGSQLYAIGGSVAAAQGANATGVGASLGANWVSNQTSAGVLGGFANSTIDITGGLTVKADNDSLIRAIAVSAGAAIGQGTGAAFTLAINLVSTDKTVFTADKSNGTLAVIENATVRAGGGVSVTAHDNGVIQAIAGALGISTKGAAFGVALGWNQIVSNVNARISNATVRGSSVTVTATATQANDLIDGKISAAAIGGAVGSKLSIGASLAINGVLGAITAKIDAGSAVQATGAITVDANDKSTIRVLTGGAALSLGGTGAGASIGANYITNTLTAAIDAATATSTGGEVKVTASETADIEALTIGLAGGDTGAVAGAVSINVITDTVIARIGDQSTVTAAGKVSVLAANTAIMGTIAGQLAIGGKAGVGAAITTAVIVNHTTAMISGAAQVLGTTGVVIDAGSTVTPSVFALGGAAGAKAGVAGSATVTVIDTTTEAYVSDVAVRPTNAFVAAGAGAGTKTGSGTTGDVAIRAHGTTTLIGAAGALTFGGTAGVGLGVDAGVVTLRTKAYIGANARVNANGSVTVDADAVDRVVSVSIAGAGGGKVAVGLTAGVSVLNIPTTATIAGGAEVFANNNVRVSAHDDTKTTLVAGNLTGAGVVAVGVAAGVQVVNKTTDASIAAGARVTALALGSAITANTGRFASATGSDETAARAVASFANAAVVMGTNTITSTGLTGTGHGFQTGDEVIYSGQRTALGGLQQGGRYFAIRVDATQFRLARTAADATAGVAIDLTDGYTVSGDQHQVELLGGVGVPSVANDQFNDPTLSANRQGAALTASRQGVVVVAVSANSMENAGAAGGGSGSVAVQVAGGVAVHTINTLAHIDAGAAVNADNTGAGANQFVHVDAGRSYHNLTLGLGVSFAGAVAVSPAVVVPVLMGTTAARIEGAAGAQTLVNARRDVEVSATAKSDMLAIAVGVSGSGTAAAAGSVAVAVIDTTTEAVIRGNARVAAFGNVFVGATDDTVVYSIAGAVGIGIGGGGGAGAVAVTSIDKTTQALIESGAIVDAQAQVGALGGIATGDFSGNDFQTKTIAGVAVQAASSETLTSVAGSGAGGLYVGIAGAVTVELVNADTIAAIRTGAQVNGNTVGTASAAQGVAVGARDRVNILSVAGALAAGFGGAGVGAGVDVNMLRNNTIATIDGANVRAAGAVDVNAIDHRTIQSNAVAVGAGAFFGLGGGISVVSIGGAFSGNYSASGESGGSATGDALSDGSGNSVQSAVDAIISAGLALIQQPGSGGLPAFNPTAAVNDSANTVDFGAAHQLATGDAVGYSSGGDTAIQGLADGTVYFVIATDANRVKLAATREDALAGVAIDIARGGASAGTHRFIAAGTDAANAARASTASSLPNAPVSFAASPASEVASGTTAAIDGGAAITANTVNVDARQKLSITAIAGGGGASIGGAIGIGVAVVSIASNVSAYVGPDVTINGLGGAGSLTVDANRDATIYASGIAGTLSGFVSLGSAVAYVTDSSDIRALIGARATDTGIVQAIAGAPTHIQGAGFATVAARAVNTLAMNITTGTGNFSYTAGLGAAISFAHSTGDTTAAIGNFALLDTVGSVTVTANSTVTIGPYTPGGPMAIGIAGGLALGATASVADTSITGAVSAEIGNGAVITASGDITVAADATNTVTESLDGLAVGFIAIGVMVGRTSIAGSVSTRAGEGSVVNGKAVTFRANGKGTGNVSAVPAVGGIGLFVGSGAVATSDISTSVHTDIDKNATITGSGAVTIKADTVSNATATAAGQNYGAVTVGISNANVTLTDTSAVAIGKGAKISGKSLSVLSNATDTATGTASGSGSSVVTISQSNTTVIVNSSSNVSVADAAQLTATNALTVEARTTITADSTPTVDSGGLGVNGATSATLTVTNNTKTSLGAATLQGDTVQVQARIVSIDAVAEPDTHARALGASSTASATTTTNSSVTVSLADGANVIGATTLDIRARQEALTTKANPHARTEGAGADTSGTAKNTLITTTKVTATGGATAESRALTVEAFAQSQPVFSAVSTLQGALIDVGDADDSSSLTLNRLIDWNGKVVLRGGPSPVLVADFVGGVPTIVQQVGLTASIKGGAVVVDDIANSGKLAGSAVFSVPASTYDSSKASNITASGIITGAPAVVFRTAFDRVDITNRTGLPLTLNKIDVINAATSFTGNVTATAPNTSGFSFTTSTDPGKTIIEIANTLTPAVQVNGLINNPFGSTTITATGGAITSGATGRIVTGPLTLKAGGSIGSAVTPLSIQTTVLSATAGGGVFVDATGDLNLLSVKAGTQASLAAGGAILAHATATGTVLTAPVIALQAGTGAIAGAGGAGTLSLSGGGVAADVNASAGGLIALSGGAEGLSLKTLLARGGDLLVDVLDLASAGQNIVLTAVSDVRSLVGAVRLRAGDNLTIADNAVVTAPTLVELAGDATTGGSDADQGDGGLIEVRGTVTAPTITITGADDPDVIALSRAGLNTAVTIKTGGGDNTVRIGSGARVGLPTPGVLTGIAGTVTVEGGAQTDSVVLDNTADPLPARPR